MRSSSVSTCRVRSCAAALGIVQGGAQERRVREFDLHSPSRTATAGRFRLCLPQPATRPHFLPSSCRADQSEASSEDGLRAAIAEDVAALVPRDDPYLLRLHTSTRPAGGAGDASQMRSVTLELNGAKAQLLTWSRGRRLADFLRERCRLTATHLGCEHGACGACTVSSTARPRAPVLRLAVMCNGQPCRRWKAWKTTRPWRCCAGIFTRATRCNAAFARRAC